MAERNCSERATRVHPGLFARLPAVSPAVEREAPGPVKRQEETGEAPRLSRSVSPPLSVSAFSALKSHPPRPASLGSSAVENNGGSSAGFYNTVVLKVFQVRRGGISLWCRSSGGRHVQHQVTGKRRRSHTHGVSPPGGERLRSVHLSTGLRSTSRSGNRVAVPVI
ncbi:unnamed protein product [Pleuronectes platessa]|uniref:Uncharacterized protein n=1 Tax=Pleuronectes platessa TaxID=8262 RepID=A0A9N7YI51_PLEPL|nr:unnamed protein product [Pleuronectes platessa]